MTQLHRVLYCSRNIIPGAIEAVAADVRGILAVSRVNNARDGVTGGLLFSEGCFAQVLEGPLDAVEAAFERIQCDARHCEVVVLQSGPIAKRDFADWSMAFVGTNAASSPLAKATLASAFSGQSSTGDDVLDMLKGLVAVLCSSRHLSRIRNEAIAAYPPGHWCSQERVDGRAACYGRAAKQAVGTRGVDEPPGAAVGAT